MAVASLQEETRAGKEKAMKIYDASYSISGGGVVNYAVIEKVEDDKRPYHLHRGSPHYASFVRLEDAIDSLIEELRSSMLEGLIKSFEISRLD